MLHAYNVHARSPLAFSTLVSERRVTKSACPVLYAAKTNNLQRDQPVTTVPNEPGICRSRQGTNTEQVGPVTRLSKGDIDGILTLITEDFNDRAYFITDPTVQFSGLARWKQNLQLLVPFLTNPKIQLLDLYVQKSTQQGPSSEPPKLQAAWTLQTSLKLPWRPFLNVIGATEYTLNADANQIVSHIESWNITPWEAIKQVFSPGK